MTSNFQPSHAVAPDAQRAPWPVVACGILMVASLTLVAGARLAGVGPSASLPSRGAQSAIVTDIEGTPPRSSRDLRFEDSEDRSVVVYDALTNEKIATVPAGTNGFLRAMLRGLAHERIRQGGSAAQPFRLSVWDDGRVRLQDVVTGRIIALEAFGITNREAFAKLVSAQRNKS